MNYSRLKQVVRPRNPLSMGLALLFLGDVLLVSQPSFLLILSSDSLRFLAVIVSILATLASFRFGLRLIAAGSGRLLDRDARKRILWLRSFQDDDIKIRWPLSEVGLRIPLAPSRFEEAVAQSVFEWGAVIAIGRPGELAPRLGAIRRYVPDEEWQSEVDEMIANSGAVLLVLGRTQGLSWELERIVRHDALPRTLILCPPISQKELSMRWTIMLRIFENLSLSLPAQLPERPLIIYFDTSFSAKFLCNKPHSARSLPGLPVSFGPYADAIAEAIEKIKTVKRVWRDVAILKAEDDEIEKNHSTSASMSSIDNLLEAAWQGVKSGIQSGVQNSVQRGVRGAFEYFRRPAAIKKRIFALFIDYLILCIFLAMLRSWAIGRWSQLAEEGVWDLAAGLFWILALVTYFACFESSPFRGTPGKRLFQIEVSDLADNRIDYLQALVRNLLKPVAFIGIFAISNAPRKQGLHDLSSQTLVVKARHTT